MTIHAPQAATPPAKEWSRPKMTPTKLTPEQLRRWNEATQRVRELAEREGWSKSEVARRSGVPVGTFWPWYEGAYNGHVHRQTQLVERWLESVDESARYFAATAEPAFVKTRTAAELVETLAVAQTLPTMAVVVLGAGMGKTYTAQHYAATHPHVTLVTMRPTTSHVRGMLLQLAVTLGVRQRQPASMDIAIGERLQRNGRQTLLIVDEAQHLIDDAVNELRHFLDVYNCGIALLGNEELYGRFGISREKAAYAQLHSRVFARLHRLKPLQADIDAYVAAWRMENREITDFVRAIGKKPGALRQIAQTLKLAHMMAAADETALSLDYVKEAWEHRGDDAPSHLRPVAG